MILVSGSLAFDQILDFPGNFSEHILPDKLHMLNVSFLVEDMRKGFGGTAGNIGYTLSLLGMKVFLMGPVGGDFHPYEQFLKKNNIDTKYIKKIDNLYTSTAIGFTDKKDNQIWGFYTGADSLSTNLSVSMVKENIDFAVIAPHNPITMKKFVRQYTHKKIPFLFDPGMQLPYFGGDSLKEAFKGAKIIIGNDYEVTIMQKKTGIENLHSLSSEDKIVITTLGEKGSKISDSNGLFTVKGAKVSESLDPTGAGDCYRAGFLGGYLRDLPLLTCGQMGSVAASYTVEKYGTSTHIFTKNEFTSRYKKNFGGNLTL